jgi:lactate dehydrogenase-like 2-hydroxyacid dehydrogenase
LSSFKVLMPAAMPEAVVEQLAKMTDLVRAWDNPDPDHVIRTAAADVRALAVGGHVGIDAQFMSRFPRLEIVASFGVGYDTIDAAWAGRNGIVVTNTPDVLNEDVADTALGLMLAAARQFPAAERHLRAGRWPHGSFPLTATLRGRTLGILGLGRIGKAIARRAEAFGLNIVYHGRRAQAGVPYLYCATVEALAEACDILVVVTPGGAATERLVDADVLRALGPNGILINIARGSVVDEAALIEALAAGTILTAGLDVFADEPNVPQALIDMDHVVLLPHVGSASQHTRAAMGQLVVDNILSWAAGHGPLTPVGETPWSPPGA